jgi:acyl-CoA synthetase (AMP-forming)/AMP-acid ligase II
VSLERENQVDVVLRDIQVIFQDSETDEAYSYADIKRRSEAVGRALIALFQWRKGDVLAMFSKNTIDYPAVVLGTLWTGGIFSPANPLYTAHELADQLKDSGARAIVTQRSLLRTAKEALRISGRPDDCIIILEDLQESFQQSLQVGSSRTGVSQDQRINIKPKKDVAFLVYSSGTTGKPKGVMLTHYNVTSNISQLQCRDQEYLTWNGSKTCRDIPLPRGGSDKLLAFSPFYHIYGLTKTIINSLFTGSTTIVMTRFEIEKWCSLVQKHSITFTYIVPPIVLLLCKHPAVPRYDFSSMRMANSGAAPLSPELVDACYRRTGIRIKQSYGMTESVTSVFNQTWDEWDIPIGGSGRLLPNVEAKLCTPIDAAETISTSIDDREPLPQGAVGELYVRGPNVFIGYHNNPLATAECLSPTGWYRSGDVGFIDKTGNLFITDRVKELIKYKGSQVAPAELEGYLTDHPLVDDCAVVGINSEELKTELPRAYIVPKGGNVAAMTQADADSIVQWLSARVANHKKLRGGVKFVPAIPKNPSGKILRRVLKGWASSEAAGSTESRVSNLRPKL